VVVVAELLVLAAIIQPLVVGLEETEGLVHLLQFLGRL
jgi:hypothetical protein